MPLEVLRKRVDRLGVAEPLLQPAGPDRITIQLPDFPQAEMEEAKATIERSAFLEFRMVHPESAELLSQNIVEPGYEILKMEVKHNGTKEVMPYLVKRETERGLTGKYLKRASVSRQPVTNEPEINFEMDSEGAKIFGEITREWSPKGASITSWRSCWIRNFNSAPPHHGSHRRRAAARSPGSFDLKEAFELANVLENPLEAPSRC